MQTPSPPFWLDRVEASTNQTSRSHFIIIPTAFSVWIHLARIRTVLRVRLFGAEAAAFCAGRSASRKLISSARHKRRQLDRRQAPGKFIQFGPSIPALYISFHHPLIWCACRISTGPELSPSALRNVANIFPSPAE
jgi:hypothetical protein